MLIQTVRNFIHDLGPAILVSACAGHPEYMYYKNTEGDRRPVCPGNYIREKELKPR